MSRPTIKTRQAAMKRYFKYANNIKKDYAHYPYKDMEIFFNYGANKYNVFTDEYSIVLTTEDIGELQDFQSVSKEDYPTNAIKFTIEALNKNEYGYKEAYIDINAVIDKAKETGYKLLKSEIHFDKKPIHLWNYGSGLLKIGLLEKAFKIVDDGEDPIVWIGNSWKVPVFIKTSIGVVVVFPLNPIKEVGKDKQKYIVEIKLDEK